MTKQPTIIVAHAAIAFRMLAAEPTVLGRPSCIVFEVANPGPVSHIGTYGAVHANINAAATVADLALVVVQIERLSDVRLDGWPSERKKAQHAYDCRLRDLTC